jgi:hypothetical protein
MGASRSYIPQPDRDVIVATRQRSLAFRTRNRDCKDISPLKVISTLSQGHIPTNLIVAVFPSPLARLLPSGLNAR